MAGSEEGHEVLTRRAIQDFQTSGKTFPENINPVWFVLGNVRTDVPNLKEDKKLSFFRFVRMFWQGLTDKKFPHHLHAMRLRETPMPQAYQRFRTGLLERMQKGCDASLSWEERALSFGSALHTLQDSYCVAHTQRVDNGDAHAPLIALHTYPSREHPLMTQKDSVWADEAHTAFKPEAAAAIAATVEALKIFATQSPEHIEEFLNHYIPFRADLYEDTEPVP